MIRGCFKLFMLVFSVIKLVLVMLGRKAAGNGSKSFWLISSSSLSNR